MRKRLFFIPVFVLFTLVSSAQCVVCTKTSADLDNKSAKGLNKGIIYLAFLPLSIMGALGVIWYRSYKNSSDNGI